MGWLPVVTSHPIVWYRLGLHGDVIRSVNGDEIETAESVLDLLQKLRHPGRVTIELERNGRLLRNEYTVVSASDVEAGGGAP